MNNYEIILPQIALFGNKQVGKTTQAKFLAQEFGYEIFNHADKVRELTCRILATYTGKTKEEIEKEFFSGDAYEIYKEQPVDIHGLFLNKGTRPMLQGVGNECREVFGEMVWIDIMMQAIRQSKHTAVIADTRYLNEMTNCYTNKIVTIHLTKAGSDKPNVPSEQVERIVAENPRKPDYTFDFTMGKKAITNAIEKIVYKEMIIPDTTHEKLALMNYKFDYFLEEDQRGELYQETMQLTRMIRNKRRLEKCEH